MIATLRSWASRSAPGWRAGNSVRPAWGMAEPYRRAGGCRGWPRRQRAGTNGDGPEDRGSRWTRARCRVRRGEAIAIACRGRRLRWRVGVGERVGGWVRVEEWQRQRPPLRFARVERRPCDRELLWREGRLRSGSASSLEQSGRRQCHASPAAGCRLVAAAEAARRTHLRPRRWTAPPVEQIGLVSAPMNGRRR